MSEPRLYLYRKTGREVWDAEMWLPDGCRRVWRTGITDRAEAENAARMRLGNLLAPALGASDARTGASSLSEADVHAVPSGAPAVPIACAMPVVPPMGPDDLAARSQSEVASAPSPARPSRGWGHRFDHWFFGDLASLWRARA